MPARLALSSVLLVVFLAACASQESRPPAGSWQEHRARLGALGNWSAEGKLALRTPELSESASLRWHQTGVITRLELSGPLGTAATTLYSDGRSLEIRRGVETSTWDLTDPAALQRETGWNLPLLALPHWIKGLPAPGSEIQAMEMGPDPALLEALEQDGWQIQYDAYALFDTLALPTRMQLTQGDTSVRLIIRDWQVSPD